MMLRAISTTTAVQACCVLQDDETGLGENKKKKLCTSQLSKQPQPKGSDNMDTDLAVRNCYWQGNKEHPP